jgi:hypothetical protein
MITIWLLLTLIAMLLIHIGIKLQPKYNQIGVVMILIGCFQLIAELIALI